MLEGLLIMKKITLPQANNLKTLSKVLDLLFKNGKATLTEVAEYVGFDLRQGSYYLSACYYFGLIDEQYKLTFYGKNSIKIFDDTITFLFYLIMTDPIMGNILSLSTINKNIDIRDYTVQLLKKYYPDYSDSLINRRASTLLGWINEVKNHILIYNKAE